MNDDQITALARELADELYNDDSSYRKILWWCEEPKERKSEELEYTLRFLLRRYCLVEKGKVEEEYIKVQMQMAEGSQLGLHTLFIHGKIKKDLLESLFPEIAKEVEE